MIKKVMHRKRLIYITVIIATIAVGLLVRIKKTWFPETLNLYLGDFLYAFMMFYAVSLLLPEKPGFSRAVIALVVCYAIEFSQLYNAGWLNEIRNSLLVRLVLGSGFLWSDLLAYFIGVVAAFAVDKLCFSQHTSAT